MSEENTGDGSFLLIDSELDACIVIYYVSK